MISDLAQQESDLAETLDLLEVGPALHRKRLLAEIRKVHGGTGANPVHGGGAPPISPAHAAPATPALVATGMRQRSRSSFSAGAVKVALTWEGSVDLDIGAVSFREGGHTLDLIYYANGKRAPAPWAPPARALRSNPTIKLVETRDRAITHSGDERGGGQGGNEESVVVKPNLMHPESAAVVVFVRCHDRYMALSAAGNAMVTVASGTQPLTVVPLGSYVDAESVAVFRMYKCQETGRWLEEVGNLRA